MRLFLKLISWSRRFDLKRFQSISDNINPLNLEKCGFDFPRFSCFFGTFFDFVVQIYMVMKISSSDKKYDRKKSFFKKIFWCQLRIIYFSTHPGTLKTVHGARRNLLRNVPALRGGPPHPLESVVENQHSPSNQDSPILTSPIEMF